MDRGMNKVVLVTRKTRLQELVRKYNTIEQAQFYIEHLGADFSDYLREEEIYRNAVKKVGAAAEKYARLQRIDRDFLPNMIFGEKDIVIAVGQDGLVANVMKYMDRQPLIGINPDPARWDGILLPFATCTRFTSSISSQRGITRRRRLQWRRRSHRTASVCWRSTICL